MSNDILTFFDRGGRAVAYLYDEEYIYLYNGTPVGFLHDDEFVYNYRGKYLGTFVDGWVRDRFGRCVFFTEDASGGPARPARHARPARSARHARPARAAREARSARAARAVAWSDFDTDGFFSSGTT
jgi:hypothetical protein